MLREINRDKVDYRIILCVIAGTLGASIFYILHVEGFYRFYVSIILDVVWFFMLDVTANKLFFTKNKKSFAENLHNTVSKEMYMFYVISFFLFTLIFTLASSMFLTRTCQNDAEYKNEVVAENSVKVDEDAKVVNNVNTFVSTEETADAGSINMNLVIIIVGIVVITGFITARRIVEIVFNRAAMEKNNL